MGRRILFCVTNDLNTDQRMMRICSSLSSNGYQVTLIGRRLPDSAAVPVKPYRQIRLFCFFNKGKLFYLEFNIRLLFYLLFKKSDAICAVDLDTLVPVFMATKLRKKICIYDAHEYFTEVPEVIRRPFVKLIWEGVAQIILPNLRCCYTVGNALALALSKRYRVEFHVIRNLSLRKKVASELQATDNQRPFLLYQGAINEGRGLELAILSMHYIDEYDLLLAGDGDIIEKLKQLTVQNGLENKVKFLGKLSPDELSKLTPKASLGIHLLENKGLSYYYSLANRTFDYIDAAVPAIHPDFPEYRNLIREYEVGALLQSYEPKQLAMQIKHILKDDAHYSFMKAECVRAQEELCWEKEERKLMALYEQFFAQVSH